MQLVRQSPLSRRAFGPDFDRLFDAWSTTEDRVWAPRADVFETQDALVARFEVPGFEVDQLDITFEDGVLRVSGERSSDEAVAEGTKYLRREFVTGRFSRALRVGDGYDAEAVEANYTNGILEIRMTKRPEVQPRKIEISTVG
jgi:HSP20 family protein